MLDALAAKPRLHQATCRLGGDDFAVRGGVIGVGVADKDAFAMRPRFMGVQPEREFGKMNRAAHILKRQGRHGESVGRPPLECKRA